MSFRINPSAVAMLAEFQRAADSQVDTAIARLDAGGDAQALVHELRRRSKKLRALLRLLAPDLRGAAKQERRLRDAARGLSARRDADVLRATLSWLAAEDPALGEAIETIMPQLRPQTAEEPALAAFRDALVDFRADIAGWRLKRDAAGLSVRGARATYRQARRAMARAQQEAHPERLHDWRKHVKYHWLQLSLLRDAFPDRAQDRRDALQALSETLGRHHDLSLLLTALGPLPPSSAEPVRRAARQHMARLEQEAFAAGAPLFHDRPRVFAETLARLAPPAVAAMHAEA